MNRRIACLLTLLLFASVHVAGARQPTKLPRIGSLYASTLANPARTEAFRQGLRELGMGGGKTLSLSIDTQRENFPILAAELVRLKVEINVAVRLLARADKVIK